MNFSQIGIIGINGKFGQLLQESLESIGYKVIGCDISTKLKLKDVISQSDIVIFTVPIRETEKVINQACQWSSNHQLWLDVTSVKEMPVKAMKKSKAYVIGLHPMFAPSDNKFDDQLVIITPGRDTKDKRYKKFVNNLFTRMGAKTIEVSPKHHDQTMSLVQQLTHFMFLSLGSALMASGKNFHKSLELVSPIYRITLTFLGRILYQDPELYFDIQTYNPYSSVTLNNFIKHAKKLDTIIVKGDRKKFVKLFNKIGNFIGKEELQAAEKISEKLIQENHRILNNKSRERRT